MRAGLMDAGPLTALLNPNDEWHTWARDTLRRLPVPLLTSEPVLTDKASNRRLAQVIRPTDACLGVCGSPILRISCRTPISGLTRSMTRSRLIGC